jgi:hypothetical protein
MTRGIERLFLDWEMTATRRVSDNIAIINVSDLEYDELFGGRSPLDAQQLTKLIMLLREASPA